MRESIKKFLLIFENNKIFGLILLIVFMPLYFKFPSFRVSGTFASIRLEDFLIAFLMSIYLSIFLYKHGVKRLLNNRYTFVVLVAFAYFSLVSVSSVISSSFLFGTTGLTLATFHFLRRIELMILILLPLLSGFTKNQLIVIIKIIFLISLIVNFYALGQKYFHFPSVSTINSELSKGKIYYLTPFDRVNSTFAGHYDLAIFSMFIIIISASKLFANRSVLSFVAFIFSFYILIETAARLTFVATFFGLGLLFIFHKKIKYIFVLIALGGLVLLYPSNLRNRLISTVKINITKSFSGYNPVNKIQIERSKLNIPTLPATGDEIETVGADAPDIAPGEPTDSTDLGVFRSFEIRTKVEWPKAIRAFYKNPILGSGYSSLGLAVDNDILRVLGETGLFGLFSFVVILYILAKNINLSINQNSNDESVKSVLIGIKAVFWAFVLNSLFIDVFEATKVASLFWILMGIVLAINYNNKEDEAK